MSTFRRRLMMAAAKSAHPYFPSDTPDAIRNSCILWYDIEKQGATNESMSVDPTLIDLTGNGYNATCYNFSWSDMSGVGGYNVNFMNYGVSSSSSSTTVERTSNKITIYPLVVNELENRITQLTRSYSSVGENTPSFQIKVTNFPTGCGMIYYYRNNQGTEKQFRITEDGVYTLPESYNTIEGTGLSTGFRFDILEDLDESYTGELTIEQMPLYPNALVSDGVDDYCLVSNLPTITTDNGFTVVSKREVTPGDEVLTAFASKQTDASEAVGAFTIERGGTDATLGYRMQVNSFGLNNEITSGNKSGIMYCTSTDYNDETSLIKGDHIDSNILVLFKLDDSSDASYCGKYALYSFLLFNRDLTQTEINWIKTNLIEGDYKFE